MAYEAITQKTTKIAAVDLSGSQFRAVVLDANGQLALPASSAVPPYGVVQERPVAGRATGVAVAGVTKMEAGAAIAAGATVMVGNDGRALTAATAGNYQFGIAEAAASGAGVVIPVLIARNGKI